MPLICINQFYGSTTISASLLRYFYRHNCSCAKPALLAEVVKRPNISAKVTSGEMLGEMFHSLSGAWIDTTVQENKIRRLRLTSLILLKATGFGDKGLLLQPMVQLKFQDYVEEWEQNSVRFVKKTYLWNFCFLLKEFGITGKWLTYKKADIPKLLAFKTKS